MSKHKKAADSYIPAACFALFLLVIAFLDFKLNPTGQGMSAMPEKTWSYTLTSKYEEVGSKEPIYCIAFNDLDPEHNRMFATCGNRRIGVYECREDGAIEPIQCYMDKNIAEQGTEEFYAVRWGRYEDTGAPLLLAAGLEGVCRVLDCNAQKLLWTAVGHGDAINDIAVQPSRPDLFLTASRDCSIRLWNLKTQVCVMIMTGDGGHTNEVLSVDFHPFRDDRFVSCGMDAHIKIWSFKHHVKYIEASSKFEKDGEKSFVTGHMGAPAFSTQKVHMGYTDCVRWMGDLILSKSVNSRIVLWRPQDQYFKNGALSATGGSANDQIQQLQEYSFHDGSIWFLRFSIDPCARILACGNQFGEIFIWDLQGSGATLAAPKARVQSLGNPKDFSKMVVRQTAVSHDGAIVLGCGDSGIISRLDRQD